MNMKCPHCLTEIYAPEEKLDLSQDADGWWGVIKRHCPACDRFIL